MSGAGALLAWELAGWACTAGSVATLALVRRNVGARMALVAEASHELRGPLTAVQLGLAGLARDAEPERARRAAALDLELRRAGLALEDLAAAPAGRRAPDRPGCVDVADLLEEALDAWAPVAAAFGATVTLAPCAEWWVVRADRVRLAQALGNLIANAIEHGRAPVRLGARRVDGRVRLEVADAGTGPPLPREPIRAHAGRRGHGLAVAARVAARAGGRLVSQSSADGLVMAIELPLVPTTPARLAPAHRRRRRAGRSRRPEVAR